MRISKTFSSMRWKIVLAYLLIIGLGYLLISQSVVRVVEDYFVQQRIKTELSTVEALAAEMAAPLTENDADSLYGNAREQGQRLGGRVLILDMQGVVQADGYSRLCGRRLQFSEVRDIMNGANLSYGFHQIEYPSYRENNPVTYPFPFLARQPPGHRPRLGGVLYRQHRFR